MLSFARRAVNWMFPRRVMHLYRDAAFALIGARLAYRCR